MITWPAVDVGDPASSATKICRRPKHLDDQAEHARLAYVGAQHHDDVADLADLVALRVEHGRPASRAAKTRVGPLLIARPRIGASCGARRGTRAVSLVADSITGILRAASMTGVPPVTTQVVILAAGLGTRLGKPHPKPLTPLRSGESIMRRAVDALRAAYGDGRPRDRRRRASSSTS